MTPLILRRTVSMAEREFRVYISSTIDDLTEERTSARLMISKYGVVSDSYRASEDGTVDNCVRDVQGADLSRELGSVAARLC